MKKYLFLLFLSACATQKKLEIKAPFSLGQAYVQPSVTQDRPSEVAYELVIPIVSLDAKKAILKNLYYRGQMAPLHIGLREIGHVAVAHFKAENPQPKVPLEDAVSEPFPFQLTETQAVVSYLEKDKVRYVVINGILQNTIVHYPNKTVEDAW